MLQTPLVANQFFQKILLPIPPENQIQHIIDATNDADDVISKLKIDQARKSPIKFSSADRIWVNGHVMSIKK